MRNRIRIERRGRARGRLGRTPESRSRPRGKGGVLAALVAGVVAASTAVALPALADHLGGSSVEVAHSGLNAEKVKTVPITRRAGAKPRVAMTLPPDEVGSIRDGDAVYASGEVEVSVTCLEPMPKCVGKIYHFSPYVRARLVLAPSATARKPSNTTPITPWKRIQCSQKLPNRNHHCVIALDGRRDVSGGTALACDRCYVSMLLEAYHGSARRGQVVVVGSDSDSGIRQDKGTLNSALLHHGGTKGQVVTTRKPSTRRVPVASQGGAGFEKKVVLSRRLVGLKRGEQVLVDGRIRVRTGHLRYGTLLQTQVVLSDKRWSVRRNGVAAKVGSDKGIITAQNGFNCTRGPSAHRSPCLVRKLGAFTVLRDAVRKPLRGEGPAVPQFVNLVMQTKAEYGGERHRSSDTVRIARKGALRVTRFGPELKR